MLSLSAASSSTILLLHAAFLLLAAMAMVAAAAASSEHRRDMTKNMTRFTNAAAAAASSVSVKGDDDEMYYCFLCTGRHPILIHMCPIYWDTCFLNCWDWDAIDPHEASAPPAPPLPPSTATSMDTAHNDDDCYVMKLYMSGRYVIVQRMGCDSIGPCYLTCGGGELDGDQKVTTTAVPATMIQGRFMPNSELCNTEAAINALRAPPSSAGGDVVPAAAAGAH